MKMDSERSVLHEIEKRFAEIDKAPAEQLTAEEEEAFLEAMALNDGSTVDLQEFKESLRDFSGKLVLNIPRSLHKRLKETAEIEGVSLDQYMLYKLSI